MSSSWLPETFTEITQTFTFLHNLRAFRRTKAMKEAIKKKKSVLHCIKPRLFVRAHANPAASRTCPTALAIVASTERRGFRYFWDSGDFQKPETHACNLSWCIADKDWARTGWLLVLGQPPAAHCAVAGKRGDRGPRAAGTGGPRTPEGAREGARSPRSPSHVYLIFTPTSTAETF